jgi:hypothetical protein
MKKRARPERRMHGNLLMIQVLVFLFSSLDALLG